MNSLLKSEDFSFANGQPKILHLSGISIDDYIAPEDIADKKFLNDEFIYSHKEFNTYEQIPSKFTSLDDWPLTTTLHCWNCDFAFDNRPAFIPTHIRSTADNCIEIGVKGNMCTFNCAARYILNIGHLNVEEKWRYQDNLSIVYFLFTGIHMQVKPAPEKTHLKKYGGSWSDEQYWNELKKIDNFSGLKDHTPGSILPERDRVIQVLDSLQSTFGVSTPIKRVICKELQIYNHKLIPGKELQISSNSVWGLCKPAIEDYTILDDLISSILDEK